MTSYEVDGCSLTIDRLMEVVSNPECVLSISEDAQYRMRSSRNMLDTLIDRGETIYGVNTNMGGMVKWLVPEAQAEALQNNLVAAVSSNVGEVFDDQTVRAAIVCRINSLARGNSAISLSVFQLLVDMYNKRVIPQVPMLGSLGTSGDLGPLAAIALVVTGRGKAKFDGEVLDGKSALAKAGLKPATLSYKDGLALINGTSFMVAVLAKAATNTKSLLTNYIAISALTFGCLNAKRKPISPSVNNLKLHSGQRRISNELYQMLGDMEGVVNESDVSRKLTQERNNEPVEGSDAVEDSYSIRCTPQILGPVKDSLEWVEDCINNEMNSSSDNPLIVIEEEDVYHCGHFHGQYIAMCGDYLKISISTLANLSERRIDRLLDHKKNTCLPPFLSVDNAGMRLGMMGAQFMSSSITSEIRSTAAPVSNQSLPTTADFQDIVSLGLIAARQALESSEKCGYVVGCEFFLGCQAVDLQNIKKYPEEVSELYNKFRKKYVFVDADRCLTDELEYAKHVVIRGGNV